MVTILHNLIVTLLFSHTDFACGEKRIDGNSYKIANRLGVNYIATKYDREFGVFMNNLMYAREKAKYIIDKGFPLIENFYSDSLADTPLALCGESPSGKESCDYGS